MACSWMSKVRAAMAGLLMAAALTACESLQSHVPPPVDGQVNTGPGGTTSAGHIRHNYTMQELVGDELGPTGGSLIAAAPEKFDQNKRQEAVAASRQSEQSPATVEQARNSTTADINGDGFVTLDEVVALKRAGLSDPEIINRLRNTDQIFSLTGQQERFLTDRGVSHAVVNAIHAMAQAPEAAQASTPATPPTTQPAE